MLTKHHSFRLAAICFWVLGSTACSSHLTFKRADPPPTEQDIRIAFLPDIHFHDIYAEFNDEAFQGLPNEKSGKNATIRTLSSELNSTRLFNENYFAFIAALDDVVAKGIKLIALPGDFSDNGQPVHMRGLAKILDDYHQRYGIEFFAAPGNHDPVRPFTQPAGKADYLGQGGYPQRIFSKGMQECQGYSTKSAKIKTTQPLATICSEEVQELGYAEIMSALATDGFYPKPSYRYWESPYSHYQPNNYDYETALKQAAFEQRQYEICHEGMGGKNKPTDYQNCVEVPDSSYLVEPIEGLWLLAIDANVYVPKAQASDANHRQTADNFSGSGNAGYNRMFSHKTQTIEWIGDVVKRAKAAGKKLIAFSHFPMTEFYNGQSSLIADYFGESTFQLARKPKNEVSQALAEMGLKVHVGGHMHMNDTGLVRNPNGQFLLNIQAPSIAAYVPAYKILRLKSDNNIEVETIILNNVPRFDELFEHYHQEYQVLKQTNPASLWNKGILTAKNYSEFTQWHISELTRQRFLPQEWPQETHRLLMSVSGQDMLIIAHLNLTLPLSELKHSTIETLRKHPQWRKAQNTAALLCSEAGLNLEDFTQWNGFDLAVDFYRLRNAGQLALHDINPSRLEQYRLLTRTLSEKRINSADEESLSSVFANQFGPIFMLLQQFQKGEPDEHFLIDMTTGALTPLP